MRFDTYLFFSAKYSHCFANSLSRYLKANGVKLVSEDCRCKPPNPEQPIALDEADVSFTDDTLAQDYAYLQSILEIRVPAIGRKRAATIVEELKKYGFILVDARDWNLSPMRTRIEELTKKTRELLDALRDL